MPGYIFYTMSNDAIGNRRANARNTTNPYRLRRGNRVCYNYNQFHPRNLIVVQGPLVNRQAPVDASADEADDDDEEVVLLADAADDFDEDFDAADATLSSDSEFSEDDELDQVDLADSSQTPVPASVSARKNCTSKVKDGKRRESKTNECAICLDEWVHPCRLPCSHIFCFLCVKGLDQGNHTCPMCRAPIPRNYSVNPQLVPTTSASSSSTSPPTGDSCKQANAGEPQKWFYEGRNGGWWQFEERMCDEIEDNISEGVTRFETMICGSLYVIDTSSLIQFRKDWPTRVRRLLKEAPSKVIMNNGVAGIRQNFLAPQ